MSDLRLRARSATELVDAAFSLYRRQPLQYILLAAIAYAPWLVLRLIALAAAAGDSTVAILLGLGSVVAYSIVSGALVRLVAQTYLGEEADLGGALRAVLPRVPALIAAALLKAFALWIGFILLVVPFFVFAARYFAVVQALVLEHRGVTASFNRSSVLSDGRKGHILGTLMLVYVVYMLLAFAILLVAGMSGNQVIAEVLSTAYVIVAYPLVAITETLLYYDARIRAEGYDVEVMANALGGTPPLERATP